MWSLLGKNEMKTLKTTNLVELFYSSDQVRVAGGVLKVHVVWNKQQTMKIRI